MINSLLKSVRTSIGVPMSIMRRPSNGLQAPLVSRIRPFASTGARFEKNGEKVSLVQALQSEIDFEHESESETGTSPPAAVMKMLEATSFKVY
jgi:hypothetical protein